MRGSILYCNGEGLTAGTSKGLCSEASSLASYNFTYNIAAIKKKISIMRCLVLNKYIISDRPHHINVKTETPGEVTVEYVHSTF